MWMIIGVGNMLSTFVGKCWSWEITDKNGLGHNIKQILRYDNMEVWYVQNWQQRGLKQERMNIDYWPRLMKISPQKCGNSWLFWQPGEATKIGFSHGNGVLTCCFDISKSSPCHVITCDISFPPERRLFVFFILWFVIWHTVAPKW